MSVVEFLLLLVAGPLQRVEQLSEWSKRFYDYSVMTPGYWELLYGHFLRFTVLADPPLLAFLRRFAQVSLQLYHLNKKYTIFGVSSSSSTFF